MAKEASGTINENSKLECGNNDREGQRIVEVFKKERLVELQAPQSLSPLLNTI